MKTRALPKLQAWLKIDGNTQAKLAVAASADPGLVSRWAAGMLRPGLSYREAIEVVTGGAVPAIDWLTDAERKRIAKAKAA